MKKLSLALMTALLLSGQVQAHEVTIVGSTGATVTGIYNDIASTFRRLFELSSSSTGKSATDEEKIEELTQLLIEIRQYRIERKKELERLERLVAAGQSDLTVQSTQSEKSEKADLADQVFVPMPARLNTYYNNFEKVYVQNTPREEVPESSSKYMAAILNLIEKSAVDQIKELKD